MGAPTREGSSQEVAIADAGREKKKLGVESRSRVRRNSSGKKEFQNRDKIAARKRGWHEREIAQRSFNGRRVSASSGEKHFNSCYGLGLSIWLGESGREYEGFVVRIATKEKTNADTPPTRESQRSESNTQSSRATSNARKKGNEKLGGWASNR